MKDSISMSSKYSFSIFLILILSSILLHAEPSVYGFGTDETVKPKASSASKRSISYLQQKIAQQDERIDGLTTVIEGLSASLNALQMKDNQSSSQQNNTSNDALLKNLAAMIDEINSNYVSKEELYEALGEKRSSTTQSNSKKSTPIANQKGKDSIEGKSNATLYSEGVRYFVKKRYSDAQKRFMVTDTNRYKPAASNYYLGEIAYYSKKYEDAIFYFKKSAGLYDKASYIDTLLLHTAVSLEKSGEKHQAKAFYENIIANYKGKKSAKIAKERLKKL